jgi:co-chaperonin GroES (HSP10)
MVNESGVIPVEYKVVVLPDEVEEKIGSIHIPDTVRDKQKHRTVKATLVAAGGNAWDGWSEPIPSPGDRVYVAVGAGIVHEGPDGKEYRIVNDKDIAGILVGD